jgi:Skp family chaperone for outer membrane proteins
LNASKDQLNQDNLALSNDERQNTLLKINADQRELKYLAESFQEDRNNRTQIEANKIFVEIINLIQKFGRDNSYDLIINEGRISQNTILNGGTLYKGASVDITNDIAKMLEKKFQENKAGG